MGVFSTLGVFVLTKFKNYGSIVAWSIFWFLLSLKPHTFLFGAVFLFYKLPTIIRIKSLLAFAFIFICLNCVLVFCSPEVFKSYLGSESFHIARSLQNYNESFFGSLLRLSVSTELAIIVLLLMWIPLIALAVRPIKIDSFQEIVALAILFNTAGLFLSFYSWVHDFQSSAGWFWATLVLGIRSGWLYWTNILGLLLINLAYLTIYTYYLSVLQSAWWILIILNLLAIYRLPTRVQDSCRMQPRA